MSNQTTTFILGIIVGVIANYIYQRLYIFFKGGTKSLLLKALEDKSNWIFDGSKNYFYVNDPDVSITISERSDTLASRYKKFPDREHNYIYYVTVKYKEVSLYFWNFMSLDGGRLFLPIPRTEYSSEHAKESTIYEFYDLNSLEIKIFEIIGTVDLMGKNSKQDGLRKVAKRLNIIITKK